MRTIYSRLKLASILFVGVFLFYSNADTQEWTVWDCSILPEDVGFMAGDNNPPGTLNFSVIIDDPEIKDNKLWKYDMYAEGNVEVSTTYRMDWDVSGTTVSTLVARIKGIDDCLSKRLAEIDIRNMEYGSILRITYDDSLFLANVDEAYAELPDLTEWHIYRVTMNGDTFTVYLDEETDPILSGASTRSTSDNWFKMGDGSDETAVSGIFDWIIWDASGAYAPDEGADIPDELYTGLETILNGDINNLKVYPIPADNKVYIEFPVKGINRNLQIINVLGETLISIEVNKQKNKIDLSGLNGGIYFIRVKQDNNTYVKRLILK